MPGSCVLVTLEGTRPMLVEIQALVDWRRSRARRLSVGLERDRLAMRCWPCCIGTRAWPAWIRACS